MSWGPTATALGGGGVKAADTSSVATLTNPVSVGDVMFIAVVCDNTQTTDGASNNVTSVVDSKGHTYQKVAEWTNGQGAAGSGITTALFVTQCSVAMTTSDTYTATYSSVTAKTMNGMKIILNPGSTYAIRAVQTGTANASTTGASLTIGGLDATREHLWVSVDGIEQAGTDVYTVDSDFSSSQQRGNSAGAGDTNASVRMQKDIATTGSVTAQGTTTTASDWASILVVLDEVDKPVSLGYATPPDLHRNRHTGPLGLRFNTRALDYYTDLPAVVSDVTVVAVEATATAAAVAPALFATLDPTPIATATAQALAPALSATLLPGAATATAAALQPVLKPTLLPAAAAATAGALTPALFVTVQPAAATATAQALVPAVIVPINIFPPVATATAQALAPTLFATVQPAAAGATSAALTPTLLVTIAPPVATATATALAPTVNIPVTMLPPVATATAAALAPVLKTTLLPAAATATAAALIPVLTSLAVMPVATATAQALTPTIRTTMLPAAATATAGALAPALFVTVTPAAATATAQALIPALIIPITIQPPVATATAGALTPTVIVTVKPAAATATAAGLVPSFAVRIIPAAATATARALVPVIIPFTGSAVGTTVINGQISHELRTPGLLQQLHGQMRNVVAVSTVRGYYTFSSGYSTGGETPTIPIQRVIVQVLFAKLAFNKGIVWDGTKLKAFNLDGSGNMTTEVTNGTDLSSVTVPMIVYVIAH